MKTKSIVTLIGSAAVALCFTACDSKEENNREKALEHQADTLEDQADAVKKQAKNTETVTKDQADAVKKDADNQADALKKEADKVREAK